MAKKSGYIKKTIELDTVAIKKLHRIFDVKTDKEAVNRALQLVTEEDEIIQTHERLAGTSDFDLLFS